ncbi:MAG: hypothetical protein M3O26_16395 [Pseudomonadota bacterium]|nr:hypothetical protein [Pseudomonadota bacterium]
MSDKQYDNTNRGALFKNDDKSEDRDPDYRGNINVDWKEFWMDAWINTAKKSGKKFMSIRVKPKMASEHKGAAKNPPAQTAKADFRDDDKIPF